MRAFAAAVVLASSGLAAGGPAHAALPVMLPGVGYEVLASGPTGGAHPSRADTVAIRYVGRLSTSEIFSTSPENGAQTAEFKVSQLIPGMSAALQLMRPGDRWRVTIPAYLGYGALGRKYLPAEHLAAQRFQHRDIPADATLVFEVELVSIAAGAAR